METKVINLYATSTSSMSMTIYDDGRIKIVSEVYGHEYDSEMNYEISKEEGEKMFSILPLENFCKQCKNCAWLDDFLEKNGIKYAAFCF